MTRRDKTELGAQLGVPESDLGDYTPRFQYRTDAALLRSQNHLREPRSDSGEGSVNSWGRTPARPRSAHCESGDGAQASAMDSSGR
jgi:hypothetical protein